MSLIGNISPYTEGEGCFESYSVHFQSFFMANDIKDQRQVFSVLDIMGSKLHGLVKDLVSLKKPEVCTFQKLTTALTKHYKPQAVTIFEWFECYLCNQGLSESVADFGAGIRPCVSTYESKDGLDEALRDKYY